MERDSKELYVNLRGEQRIRRRYHVPGQSSLAGDYEGVDQVIGLFVRLFELSGGTLPIALHDVIANDEHVADLLTMRAERNGKQLEDQAVLIAHVTDGKFAEIWTYQTHQYAVDEFYS
jgi:uncharacterized protein